MKLLAFTDSHGELKDFEKLKAKVLRRKPDVLVCAGDITFFGHGMKQQLRKLNALKKPIFLIPGNHEEHADLKKIVKKYKNIIYIHDRAKQFMGYLFVGHGGGGFSVLDKKLIKLAPRLEKAMKRAQKVIFITHAPPYKTKVDKLGKNYVGNKTIRNFISKNRRKIVLHICGHIHENKRKEDMIGKVRTINPGPTGKIIML